MIVSHDGCMSAFPKQTAAGATVMPLSVRLYLRLLAGPSRYKIVAHQRDGAKESGAPENPRNRTQGPASWHAVAINRRNS